MNITNFPTHVGVIMDGNGRWAQKRKLPRPVGHRNGVKSVRSTIDACDSYGIKYLTLYVFSAENFQRPATEVTLLMKLFVEMMKKELKTLHSKNVKIIALGNLAKLPDSTKKVMQEAMDNTKNNTGLTLQLAFSYGGRAEIIDAMKKLHADGVSIEDLDEKTFSRYLYAPETPDPELIIRTGGDKRISNFLLWQSAYSELYFTETLWPDFDEAELLKAFEEFQNRERRFGKVLSE